MGVKQSPFCILLLLLHLNKAFNITDSYINELLKRAQRDPINPQTAVLRNNALNVAEDNSNEIAGNEFIETYTLGDDLSQGSVKSNSEISVFKELNSLVGQELSEIGDPERRQIKWNEKTNDKNEINDNKADFTKTCMFGKLESNDQSEMSTKDSEISVPMELNSLVGQPSKREIKRDAMNKLKSIHKSTQRSVPPSSSGSATLWEEWTPWSSCSVSCGKGRHIRWRHCLQNCNEAETEMEEKSCQMPACPQKLFGLINL